MLEDFFIAIALSRCGNRNILALNFNLRQRRQCLLHHYKFLSEAVSGNILGRISDQQILLWSKSVNDVFSVKLYCEEDYIEEGELTLDFLVNQTSIFVISFTIIPGDVVGAPFRDVILVSRMQGRFGRMPEIRRATKSLDDISPQAVLFATLRGIGRALGIATIACVSAENQPSFPKVSETLLIKRYDEFLLSIGAVGPSDGLWVFDNSSLETKRRPASHRSRALSKRNVKMEIARSVETSWVNMSQTAEQAEETEEIRTMKAFLEIKPDSRLFLRKQLLEYYILKTGSFDTEFYYSRNKDVQDAGLDPIWHYLRFGAREFRNPHQNFDTRTYVQSHSLRSQDKINPFVRFHLERGRISKFAPC